MAMDLMMPETVDVPDPARPRRRVLLWAVIVTIVLAAGLGAAIIWAAHYQPMTSGFRSGATSDEVTVVHKGNALGDEYRLVEPAPGAAAVAFFGLALPDAPFAVTVENVGPPFPLTGDRWTIGLLDEADVWIRANGETGRYERFSPRTLSPGNFWDLQLRPGRCRLRDTSHGLVGLVHRPDDPIDLLRLRDDPYRRYAARIRAEHQGWPAVLGADRPRWRHRSR